MLCRDCALTVGLMREAWTERTRTPSADRRKLTAPGRLLSPQDRNHCLITDDMKDRGQRS